MTFRKILICIFILSLCFGCARKATENSLLSIQIDKSGFKKVSEKINLVPFSQDFEGDENDDDSWGLPNPTSVSDLNCFAVFIGAAEAGMNDSYCTNDYNKEFIRFGPHAGLFSFGEKAELSVSSGPGRTIYLAGMVSQNGKCAVDLIEENNDLDKSQFSQPYLIGKVKKDLFDKQVVVEIPVHGNFTPDNKLTDCSFMSKEKPLHLSFYRSTRKTWVDDNILARTVKISHGGQKLECSRNGTEFDSCDSNSTFIWRVTDQGNTHIVRVTYEDGSTETESFVPSDLYPQLSDFVTCDFEIDEDFDSSNTPLVAKLNTANSVVCLGDGVTIKNYGSTATVNANVKDVTMVARQGDSVEIIQDASSPLLSSNASNRRYIGLSFINNNSGPQHGMMIYQGPVSFENCIMKRTLQSSSVLFVTSSAATTVDIYQSTIHNVTENSNGRGIFVNSFGTIVNLEQSVVSGASTSIDLKAGTVNVNASILHVEKIASNNNKVVQVLPNASKTATANIYDSILFDGTGEGLQINGGYSSGDTATLNLNNNYIVRLDIAGSNNPAINIVSDANAGDKYLLSSNSEPNYFCNIDPGVASFTYISSGGQTILGTSLDLNVSSQLFSGLNVSVSNCDSYPEVINAMEKYLQ